MFARSQHDVAAVSTVSAARAASRHEFLPAERQATIAAVSGFHGNYYFIDK
jgi:hypothetical protein